MFDWEDIFYHAAAAFALVFFLTWAFSFPMGLHASAALCVSINGMFWFIREAVQYDLRNDLGWAKAFRECFESPQKLAEWVAPAVTGLLAAGMVVAKYG